jgi:hypothetical protein
VKKSPRYIDCFCFDFWPRFFPKRSKRAIFKNQNKASRGNFFCQLSACRPLVCEKSTIKMSGFAQNLLWELTLKRQRICNNL